MNYVMHETSGCTDSCIACAEERAMWAVETEGHRIGPDWYTEATGFKTEKDAEAWAADNVHNLIGEGRRVRIRLEGR